MMKPRMNHCPNRYAAQVDSSQYPDPPPPVARSPAHDPAAQPKRHYHTARAGRLVTFVTTPQQPQERNPLQRNDFGHIDTATPYRPVTPSASFRASRAVRSGRVLIPLATREHTDAHRSTGHAAAWRGYRRIDDAPVCAYNVYARTLNVRMCSKMERST